MKEFNDIYINRLGCFNPFRNVSFANRVFWKIIYLFDEYTPINRLSIFEHRYSYYFKTR